MSDINPSLFVYGSLRDPDVFESICGFRFQLPDESSDPEDITDAQIIDCRPAILDGYRKISPDDVYFYASADANSRIDGLLLSPVSEQAIGDIDYYEGRRYRRRTVTVNTADGPVEAFAYLDANERLKNQKPHGDRFHVNLIHELWLRKRITKFIEAQTRPGDKSYDAELERRARRELLAFTERDLIITHYGKDAFSDYFLKNQLERPFPSIKHLYSDAQAKPFIKNYLTLVIKQVFLNQFDEKFQRRYRFELEHLYSERYFKRSVSLLASLQMINANSMPMDVIISRGLKLIEDENNDLIDYAKYAIGAADELFDYRLARSYLDRIIANRQPGLIPLGVELELSNVGCSAVEPQRTIFGNPDTMYDNFRYFKDFHLDILCWKLGGYIDDHIGSSDCGCKGGFLEFAPGRLNFKGDISRPATNDPWLLNELICAIVTFYDIKPHSLHLTFQLRKNQINRQKILPLDFVKCLLVLGGGLYRQDNGSYHFSRMDNDEITQYRYGEEFSFAKSSKRKWCLSGGDILEKPPAQATTYTQQYKFIRLSSKCSYEPLIVCLKGLQVSYNPGDYLSLEQLKDPSLRFEYQELKRWSSSPVKIAASSIAAFLDTIRNGLLNEGHNEPVHLAHYIDWVVTSIESQLQDFNDKVR